MKVYKGTNKDMKCTPVDGVEFQYEIGKTYEKPKAELCKHGFHACEAPLDVLRYYSPAYGSRYFEAELNDVSPERNGDSKVCGKKITIGAEICIPGLAKAHVEWVKTKCEESREETASGVRGNAAASGERGTATVTGNFGRAEANGEQTIAVAWGYESKARGKIGSWIVCTEYDKDGVKIVSAKMAVVDGESIKPDTWYTLKDGEFVEVEDA